MVQAGEHRMIFGRFGRRTDDETPRAIYEKIVAGARRPEFYVDHGVPDTVEGRYEMIVLHLFLYLHRLRREDAAARGLGQRVFDTMFMDMDRSLREMGVGDLTVPKKIKKMAQAFYGRTAAFDAALEAGDGAELRVAIARNVYGEGNGTEPRAATLSAYVERAAAALAAQPLAVLTSEGPVFPDPVPAQVTAS
jgi:cytochrome b pre-mRNA-processing protein 3